MQKYGWIAIFIAIFNATAYAGVGTITFTSRNIVYTMGSDVFLDPGIQISNTTTWGGGSIYLQIETVTGTSNPSDLLTCTLANASHMSSTFSTATHALLITADSSATLADIQSTLRTVKFSTNGQNPNTRKIRFIIADTSAGLTILADYNSQYRVFRYNATYDTQANHENTIIPTSYASVYGMTGYLANVTSETLRQAISRQVLPQSNGSNIFYFTGGLYSNGSWSWLYGPEAGTNTGLTGSAPGAAYTPNNANSAWSFSSFSGTMHLELDDDINGSNGNVNYQFDYETTSTAGGIYEYGGQNTDLNYITVQTHAPNALFLGSPF